MKKLKILLILLVVVCLAAPMSVYAFVSKNLNNANEFIQEVEDKLSIAQENNEELIANIDELNNELIIAQDIIEDLALKLTKYEEPKSYTDEDVMLLAKVMYHENGCDWFPNIIQLITGSVVLNRIKDDYYPDTLYGVVYDPGQYVCAWNGSFNIEPNERALENAKFLLEYGSIIPENVVYQSGAPQGSGTYFEFYDPVLNIREYFCYK